MPSVYGDRVKISETVSERLWITQITVCLHATQERVVVRMDTKSAYHTAHAQVTDLRSQNARSRKGDVARRAEFFAHTVNVK